MAVSQHSNDILMNLWREKVVSPSYSSAILGLPPSLHFKYHLGLEGGENSILGGEPEEHSKQH